MSQQLVHTHDLVEARLYENEDEVIQDALRHLLSDRPDLRVSVAIHRYRTDEELSLNQAAAIAGVSLERMKEILERHDVPLRLGPATIEEAKAEIAAIEERLGAHSEREAEMDSMPPFSEPESTSDREQVLAALRSAGILVDLDPALAVKYRASADQQDRTPVQVKGTPLSKMIVAERHRC